MTPICQAATNAQPARGIPVRAQIALAACGCAGISTFLYAVDPVRHAVYPQCWLYNTTGFYCAGCGATRAIHALLHGRILTALHDNALLIASLPLLLFVIGAYTLTAWRDRAWPKINVDARRLVQFAIVAVVVMLAFMTLRNLPGELFACLKPLQG